MYSGGSGTALDPYLIATPQDFYDIRANLNAHFRQVSDVDFSGQGIFTAPDGDFKGTYNGADFAIKNAEIEGGLFGTVTGANTLLQNIRLEDSNIVSAGDHTGGIARSLQGYAAIQYCRVEGGKIESASSYTGGIVGRMSYAIVRFCWTDILIEAARNYTGGIAGYCERGLSSRGVFNCYSHSDVLSTSNHVGGIVGRSGPYSPVTRNCYATGFVQGNNYVGGIVGYNDGGVGLQQNVALNKGIIRIEGSTGEDFGRVYGYADSKTNIENNYALEDMKFYPSGFAR